MTDMPAVIAQLRHAYAQLAAGTVKNQKQFADGLIAPAIRALEQFPDVAAEAPDREAVARIIDPRNFEMNEISASSYTADGIKEALRKADAILALIGGVAQAEPVPDIEHLKDYGENGYANMTAGDAYKKGFEAGGAWALSSTPRATYCEHCDMEHELHHDEVTGFHHVIKGETVRCTLPSTTRETPRKLPK